MKKNISLEQAFMEKLNSLSSAELEEQLLSAEPTGFGDLIHEDLVFSLLDEVFTSSFSTYCIGGGMLSSSLYESYSKTLLTEPAANESAANEPDYRYMDLAA